MMFYLGLGCFFGAHSLGLLPSVRRALTDKLTERGYMGAYTLISVLGIGLMVAGYSSEAFVQWGVVVPVVRDLSPWIMLLAFWLVVAANLPCWTRHLTRHPMTLGISIWAFSHLVLNPDLHSWWLFGSFLVFVVLSALTTGYRGKSIAVFIPKLQFDLLAMVLSGALTVTVYYFHGDLFGVAVR